MDKPVMFNGRLSKDQVEVWLKILRETSETSYKNHNLAKSFLLLPESITFVSSLENKIIGGTSIYRDKTRLAMVLASVAVEKEFRDSAAFQIIKSSLPFFKTVAIRDVDALVSRDGSTNPLSFPLSLELDPWATEILKRIGFLKIANLEHWSFTLDKSIDKTPLAWTEEVNSDEVRELIWDQSKPMGLTNSLVWLARDFSVEMNCLVTIERNGKTEAVVGFWKLSDRFCIYPVVSDPERLSWERLADALIAMALESGMTKIELPLVGEGQGNLAQALENKSHQSSCRKLSLLRKPL
ncbi:MAG: hypothetical protein ACFFE7_11445 [Candidatus Thorarchaeota archaeon]